MNIVFFSLVILLTAANALLFAQSKRDFNSQETLTITTLHVDRMSLS